jgi:hypothetical protein
MPGDTAYEQEIVVSRWLKNVGDEIEIGDQLLQIRADTVSYTLGIIEAGKLSQICATKGSRVDPGQRIATLVPRPLKPSPDATIASESHLQVPHYEPPAKRVRPLDIVHWAGWVMVVCGPWYVSSKLDDLLRKSATWLYWPAGILLLLISAAVPLYFLADLLRKNDESRPDNSKSGIEKWFRSHWPTMPADCKILVSDVVDSRFHPIVARICVDDGHDFGITLYYDLRTKQLLGCRASPTPTT